MNDYFLKNPIIKKHNNIYVLRDDLLEGGSKSRFLPYIIGDAKEIVFGAPVCGGAPYALSVFGKHFNRKITLFYAQTKKLNKRQEACYDNGANIRMVPFGYMTNVQAKARKYAEENNALFLPLGFDVEQAEKPFVSLMKNVRDNYGQFNQVWCAVGSGMLARCLSKGFPDAEINGVVVGLKSRNEKQNYNKNVILHECNYKFQTECKYVSPFPTCNNYDRKAWEICEKESKGRVLFWNVMSNH
tara:strand:- start:208 stop:936 length:729 start_codon:yes stop_codon:yes gene_type:complete